MICTAISSEGAFGLRGALPWHIREELAHFRSLTLGKTVLVGKHTVLPPLPGRVVLQADRNTKDYPENIVLIGGKTLIQALQHQPRWRVWHLTVIHFPIPIEADTFFHPDLTGWTLVEERVEKGWCRKNLCEVTLRFQTYTKDS